MKFTSMKYLIPLFFLFLVGPNALAQAPAAPSATINLLATGDDLDLDMVVEITLPNHSIKKVHLKVGSASGEADIFDHTIDLEEFDYGPVQSFAKDGLVLTLHLGGQEDRDFFGEAWCINAQDQSSSITPITYQKGQ